MHIFMYLCTTHVLPHSPWFYLLAILEKCYFLTAYQDIKGSVSVLFLYLHIHMFFSISLFFCQTQTLSPIL